jgi:hypothetical protein
MYQTADRFFCSNKTEASLARRYGVRRQGSVGVVETDGVASDFGPAGLVVLAVSGVLGSCPLFDVIHAAQCLDVALSHCCSSCCDGIEIGSAHLDMPPLHTELSDSFVNLILNYFQDF